MKRKSRTILIIALIAGFLLGGSGLLGGSVGAVIGLCSLTISIFWLLIYSVTHGERINKENVRSVIEILLQWGVPICAVFWWGLGSLVWHDNTTLRAVTFCLALPCLLMMPARKLLFSIDGVAFHIKLPGLHPIIVKIIIIGLVLGSVFLGVKGCIKQNSEKKYIDALEKIEVEAYDQHFNESTGKFDFAIRLKNGTAYTVTDMRFEMEVYDETAELLVDTSFYIPEGSVFSPGEERCFYVYVKQRDVESVETLYYADFDSLDIQLRIAEVEYEEYDFPLSVSD